MKNYIFLLLSLKCSVIFFSCTSKKHKPKLNLLFSTTITIYSNDENSNKKYDTQIAISDSVFLTQKYIAGHSENYGLPIVNLWINGDVKSENTTFDSLVKKHNLTVIWLNKFVQYESHISERNIVDSLGFVHSPLGSMSIRKTVKKLTNTEILAFTDSINSTKNTLQFISKTDTTIFLLDKKTTTIQMMDSYMKLYNIASDKKEEIFIFTPEFTYKGLGWFVQVYQIQD